MLMWKRPDNRLRLARWTLLVAAAVVAGGCATTPPPATRTDRLLPADQSGYLAVDVAAITTHCPLLLDPDRLAELSLSGADATAPAHDATRDLKRFLERTARISASFRVHETAPPTVYGTASGRYPYRFTTFALRRSPAFERTPAADGAPVRYTYSTVDRRLQLAVPEPGLVIFGTGPLAPVLDAYAQQASGAPGGTTVEGTAPVRRLWVQPDAGMSVALVRLTLPDPGARVLAELGIALPGLSVEEVGFQLGVPCSAEVGLSGEVVELSGVFRFPGERQASLFRRVSRGLLLLLLNGLGLPSGELAATAVIEQDGAQVAFRGVHLAVQDAADLMVRLLTATGAVGGTL